MLKQIFKSFIPIASSAVSGIFGQFSQNKQLREQERANNIAFERNKELAALQNQYNIDQWNRENLYNTPVAQMSRLREGGVNPDLFYGGGTSGMTSATSPSMAAGTPIQPVDYTMGGQRKTIADTIQSTLNTAMQQAQIEKINAETNKLNLESEGISINNSTLYQTNTANIRKMLTDAGLNERNADLATQKIEESKAYIDGIKASISEKFANIDNMTFQQFYSMLQYDLDSKESKARVDNLVANTQFTKTQILQIYKVLPSVLAKYSAEIGLLKAQTATESQNYFKVIGDIALNVAKEANLDASTESMEIANLRSRDTAKRYLNLWDVNKDILFVIQELLGSLPVILPKTQ